VNKENPQCSLCFIIGILNLRETVIRGNKKEILIGGNFDG